MGFQQVSQTSLEHIHFHLEFCYAVHTLHLDVTHSRELGFTIKDEHGHNLSQNVLPSH